MRMHFPVNPNLLNSSVNSEGEGSPSKIGGGLGKTLEDNGVSDPLPCKFTGGGVLNVEFGLAGFVCEVIPSVGG